MADAGRLHLDQHFAGAWAFQLHGHHFQRFASLNGNGGADIHQTSPPLSMHGFIFSSLFQSSNRRPLLPIHCMSGNARDYKLSLMHGGEGGCHWVIL
jgi:hypothetical protein